MGCGNSRTAPALTVRNTKNIVILGASGDLGQAVVKALTNQDEFRVTAVTRYPRSKRADKLRHLGATVVQGTFDDIIGLKEILSEAHGCFAVSSYWSSLSKEREIKQGKDAIYVARKCGVRHFVYSGNVMASTLIGRKCNPLDGKAVIEEYLRQPSGRVDGANMKYTVIRIPFLYDNLLSLLKPQPLANGKHAVALPMEGYPIDGISSDDVGRCVRDIFRYPVHFCNRVLKLTADSNTVEELATMLSRHLWPKEFVDSKIRVTDFEKFGFQEARDFASVFRFYQLYNGEKDLVKTRKMFPYVRSFEEWVIDEQQRLNEVTRSLRDNDGSLSTSVSSLQDCT